MFLSSKWAGRFAREQGFEAVCMLFVGLVERMRTGGCSTLPGLWVKSNCVFPVRFPSATLKPPKGGRI